MINFPPNQTQNLDFNQNFEYQKKRKPIKNYIVSIFNQFDFNVWESEQSITQVRANKNDVEDANEFLKNVTTMLKIKTDTSNAKKIEAKNLAELINGITHDFKYDLKIPEDFIDAVEMENDWNNKEVLIETDSELIYVQWDTTA